MRRQVSFKLDAELVAAMDAYAAEHSITRTALLEEALTAHLSHADEQRASTATTPTDVSERPSQTVSVPSTWYRPDSATAKDTVPVDRALLDAAKRMLR